MLLFSLGSSYAAGSAGHELVAESDDQVTFTVRLPHYRLDAVVQDAVEYARPFAPGLVPFAAVGAPDLWLYPVLLAVPEGAEVSVVSFTVDAWTVLEDLDSPGPQGGNRRGRPRWPSGLRL